jgi:hypothetical protein
MNEAGVAAAGAEGAMSKADVAAVARSGATSEVGVVVTGAESAISRAGVAESMRSSAPSESGVVPTGIDSGASNVARVANHPLRKLVESQLPQIALKREPALPRPKWTPP